MPRFKLTIEYNGTRYSGWQIQKNARTVQGELEQAIRTVTGPHQFELQGAGRTDAGVHALAQVAHLDASWTEAPIRLIQKINDELPSDINVLAIEKVPHRFHARHDAVARSYLYQIARRRTAFGKAFVWWPRADLDLEGMRAAARQFTGMKDFRSFTDDDAALKSTKVLVEGIDVVEQDDLILVRIEGSHFLWKMVRRIVGVLVGVGKDELSIERVRTFFAEDSDLPAKLTAPASGLFLERVYYDGDERAPAPHPVLNLGRFRSAG
jgi:tRNA pseudouridine38-40 synthase